ncbi:MAG: single-stranded-DNA-specific exonuclease RecJ, partial [Planctomycetota bacterium]
MPAKKWKFTPHDRAEIESLVERAGVSPIVAQLLLNRGITEQEDVTRFLEAKLTDLRPPEELPGLPAAVERIMKAISGEEEIVVYGDYDADGMTA